METRLEILNLRGKLGGEGITILNQTNIMSFFLNVFIFLLFSFSCKHPNSHGKINYKKISLVFDKAYNNDTLLLMIDDSLVFNRIIETDPSVGIATSKIIHTSKDKLKIQIAVNGHKLFDSMVQVKSMWSYFFSYDTLYKTILFKNINKIYLYD